MMMTLGKPAGAGSLQLLTLGAAVFIVINTLLVTSAAGQRYENDNCTIKDGSPGFCSLIENCPWYAENVLKQRLQEGVRCSWKDVNTEIICCKSVAVGSRASAACEQWPHSSLLFHITEGEEAEDGEFPYMASLGYRNVDTSKGYDFRCGASLISRNFLLTAAHCMKGGEPLVALFGTIDLTKPVLLVRIKKIYRHKSYSKKTKHNDIALLELDREIKDHPLVHPICLDMVGKDRPSNENLTTVGFGITDDDEGDDCTLKDGTEGICKEVPKCPWFVENIIKKKRTGERVSCGFNGPVEIICCKSDELKVGRRSSLACDRVPEIENRLTFHIIDGEEADDGEFPFMAALGYPNEDGATGYDYRCGASLISERFLLTAAHCIPAKARPVVALLGTNDLASADPGLVVNLKEFYPHPEYKSSQSYNDIALVELERDLKNEPNVNPICLYGDLKDLPDQTVLTAEGYGIIDVDRQKRSQLLMKVNLTTVALDKCNQTFADSNLLKNNRKLSKGLIETQYCATGRENTVTKQIGDTCQGDSGGPLQIQQDGKYKLVGVTSFGNGCGSNTPSVYTRVARYIAWIESVVWAHVAV